MTLDEGGLTRSTPSRSDDHLDMLDHAVVVEFLQLQATVMQSGLAHAEDDLERFTVLRSHDSAHPAWLRLIATVERDGFAQLAERIAELYAFHGRIAESLEREASLRLPVPLASGVRRILTDQLEQFTESCVREIETLDKAGAAEASSG